MAVRRGIAATIRALFAGVLARALALLGAFFCRVSLPSVGRLRGSASFWCVFFPAISRFGAFLLGFSFFWDPSGFGRPTCGLELGARIGAPWFAAPAGAAVCFPARCALGLRASDSGKQRRGTRRLI